MVKEILSLVLIEILNVRPEITIAGIKVAIAKPQ
jgi:hypothetical protein